MSRLLFVVHRYAPFPGGSEYYVQDMAEAALIKGHDVTVLTHEHKGDISGVKVTSDYQILKQKWDLIVVHGADCYTQNIVHQNAVMINSISPVLYLLIKPSESKHANYGLSQHRFIGYSTKADVDFLMKKGVAKKMRRVPHGITPARTCVSKTRTDGSSGKFIVTSAGGFWPHKRMTELADAWKACPTFQNNSMELHLYGYGELANAPLDGPNVFVHKGMSKESVIGAIARSDAYVMNSSEEGFGLVLLEAMINKTPWFARDIAGAHDMKQYGTIYSDEQDLMQKLKTYVRDDRKLQNGFDFVMANHTITDTVIGIENVLLECM